MAKQFEQHGIADDGFTEHLVRWADTIRKAFREGAVDEIISTRRLVNIVTAFAMFKDRKRSIELSIARFDDDTRESFLNLYSKVDADVIITPEGNDSTTDTKCPF